MPPLGPSQSGMTTWLYIYVFIGGLHHLVRHVQYDHMAQEMLHLLYYMYL